MKEKDIHDLIEQEEAETKERIWKRIFSQLNLQRAVQQTENDYVSKDTNVADPKQNKSSSALYI